MAVSAPRARRAVTTGTIRGAIGLTILAVVVLCVGNAAGAHAVLEEITPSDGATVEQTPSEVTLTFNEPVSLAGGSARVLDDIGDEVSLDATVTDAVVSIDLPDELDDGTYVVAWQVISTDSHRVSGTSVFHVGAASADTDEVLAGIDTDLSADAAPWLRLVAILAAATLYGAALIAAGLWWFRRVIARVPPDDQIAARLQRVVAVTATIGVGAALVSAPLRIARLGGGFSALTDGEFVRETGTGPIGTALATSTLGLLMLLVARSRLAAGSGTVLAIAGFAIEGHTRTLDPRWVMAGFDVAHIAAAAAWLGGLIGIIVLLRHETHAGRSGAAVTRFSRLAAVIVIAMALAGVTMSVIVLPDLSALWDTGYGLALITKVALVVVALGFGAYNRRRVNAPGEEGADSASDQPSPPSRPMLWSIVSIEVAIMLAVVVSTAVLVGRSPTATSEASPTDSSMGPISVDVELSGDAGVAAIGLTPAQVGSNELWIELTDPRGQPLSPYDPPSVELRERSRELGPLNPDVHDIGNDTTYHSYVDIPLDGHWEIVIRVRTNEFTSVSATTTLDIQP